MPSRKDPKVLPKVLARNRTQRSCVGTARRSVIYLPDVNDSGKSKGSKTGDSKGKSNKKEFKWQYWSHVEGLQNQRNECIRSWRRVGRDGMHRNGKHRFECIGDRSSAFVRRRSQNSYWDRLVCCSDCVPEECCGRLPDDQTPGKAKSYKLASGKLLPDLGVRNVQVKLKDGSLRYLNPRTADTHRALMAVSVMNDMSHDVFFHQERQKHQGMCVPRGQ